MTSPTLTEGMTLTEKMCGIADDIGAVAKSAKNDFHKYKYTPAEAVILAFQKARAKWGVKLDCSIDVLRDTVDANGKNDVTIRMTFVFSDDSDDTCTVQALGCGSDKTDKAPMKAMTAAHKYALAIAFSVPFGDDPEATDADGNSTAARAPGRPQAAPKSKTGGADEVLLAIAACGSLDALKALRASVVDLKADPRYQELTSAYKQKESELNV